MTTSTRRNALCPCGSGLKFKRCCLPKMVVRLPEYVPASTRGEKDVSPEIALAALALVGMRRFR